MTDLQIMQWREKRRENPIQPTKKFGPLFDSTRYKDTKDPCPVYDGHQYHIFGSGGDVRNEEWDILHARSMSIDGPWHECESVKLNGLSGKRVAAPGVVYDEQDGLFHMFVQTDFTTQDSSIDYLVSKDGESFDKVEKILTPSEEDKEIALYDPHPVTAGEEKYIVYSATTPGEERFVPRPDIFLAKSTSATWKGPWKRMGKILDHMDIAEHHNRKDDPMYEWGIEGPQIVMLSNGGFLLNATCFMPGGMFGTRQRVFFAMAHDIQGPYRTIGPVIHPQGEREEWESGENGHAAILKKDKSVYLFYQGRSKSNPTVVENNWRYGIAEFEETCFDA